MKILVLPDIHQKHEKAFALIKEEKYDKIIFLGDAFDSFEENHEDTYETARLYNTLVSNKENTILFGNHDVHYFYPRNPYLKCPGFDQTKLMITASLIGDRFKNAKWLHWEKNVCFSHAGVMPHLLKFDSLEKNKSYLYQESKIAFESADTFKDHMFFTRGVGRNGKSFFPGLIWADFLTEMANNSFCQVVGHSYVKRPTLKIGDNFEIAPKIVDFNGEAFTLCLDSDFNHYMIFDTESQIGEIKEICKKL